jgi:hypothetical protein
MKNIIQEEINRAKQLMGVISESNLLLEEPLTDTQRHKFATCAIHGGGFWCAESAGECAEILISGDNGACTGMVSPGTTDNELELDRSQDKTAGPEPTDTIDVEFGINEGLILEGEKKFWRQLEACREEVSETGDEGKKCRKFRRNYG